jgi:hypothetical protein
MERKEGFDMDGIEKIFLPFKRSYLSSFFTASKKLFSSFWISTFRLINSRDKDTLQLTTIYRELESHLVHLDRLSVGIEQLEAKS